MFKIITKWLCPKPIEFPLGSSQAVPIKLRHLKSLCDRMWSSDLGDPERGLLRKCHFVEAEALLDRYGISPSDRPEAYKQITVGASFRHPIDPSRLRTAIIRTRYPQESAVIEQVLAAKFPGAVDLSEGDWAKLEAVQSQHRQSSAVPRTLSAGLQSAMDLSKEDWREIREVEEASAQPFFGEPQDRELVHQRYKMVEKRIDCVKEGGGGQGIHGFDYRYTGVGAHLGVATVENSPLAADQMEWVLALSRHPLVEDLIRDKSINAGNFNVEPLAKAQVLRGLRILDLGCGTMPTFARCCRRLGAVVYTVDFCTINFGLATDAFKGHSDLSPLDRYLEERDHLGLDLGSPKGGL